MAALLAQPGNGMLFLGGQKISGADVRDQNGGLHHSPHMHAAAQHTQLSQLGQHRAEVHLDYVMVCCRPMLIVAGIGPGPTAIFWWDLDGGQRGRRGGADLAARRCQSAALALRFGVTLQLHILTVLKIEAVWVIYCAAQPDFWLFIAVI